MVGGTSCANSGEDLAIKEPPKLVFGERRVEMAEIIDEYNTLRDTFIESERSFAECVRALGYEYDPRRIEIALPDTEHFPTVAELRRTHGYGIVNGEGNTGSAVEISGGTVPVAQNADFSTKVWMDDEGDCIQFHLQPDFQEALHQLRSVDAIPSERLLADARYAEALESWRSCMAEKGFLYRNRSEPFADVETRLSTLDPLADNYEQARKDLEAAEIRIASADIDCHLAEIEPVIAALVEMHG